MGARVLFFSSAILQARNIIWILCRFLHLLGISSSFLQFLLLLHQCIPHIVLPCYLVLSKIRYGQPWNSPQTYGCLSPGYNHFCKLNHQCPQVHTDFSLLGFVSRYLGCLRTHWFSLCMHKFLCDGGPLANHPGPQHLCNCNLRFDRLIIHRRRSNSRSCRFLGQLSIRLFFFCRACCSNRSLNLHQLNPYDRWNDLNLYKC